jgi:hypothetical protein
MPKDSHTVKTTNRPTKATITACQRGSFGVLRIPSNHVMNISEVQEYGKAKLAPLPSARPAAFDDRVPSLLFDSLACVQAAILSTSSKLPYRDLRQVLLCSEGEKCELTSAALTVAAKHPAFFSQHKQFLEFAVAWARVNSPKVDQLYSLAEECDEKVCSAREALGAALLVLAPLAVFALVLIMKSRRE